MTLELRDLRQSLPWVLHPGWVRTDMGGASAPLEIGESIRQMMATIQGAAAEKSGEFLDFAGRPIPW